MYERKTRIRFSEADSAGRLTMSALLRLYQDLIFSYVADKGLGREYTQRTGRTWFRLSWQIDVMRMPQVNDEVTLSAIITDVRQSLVYMEISMNSAAGEQLAIGDDMLAYMNIAEGLPITHDESIWPKEDFAPKSDHQFKGRKIILPKTDSFTFKEAFQIGEHLLDINGHANNVRLIEKAMETCGIVDHHARSLRAEFKMQILPGWVISAYINESAGTVKVLFRNEYGLLCNVFEFTC